MHKEFRFPDVGEGITEGEIVKWLVKEGERVKQDQPLVQVETDKAVVDLPSPYEGTVVRLYGKEGDLIKVGDVLFTVSVTDVAAPPRKDSGTVVGQIEEAEEEPEILAVPAVRALAKERGVDLAGVKGTGPKGRITRQDVEKAASAKIAGKKGPARITDPYGAVEEIPLRGLRRSTARHMAEAARMIPAVTTMDEADVTLLDEIKYKEKQAAQEMGAKLTYLPFVIKAVIAGLKAHPYLNASLDAEKEVILLKKYYNIGIAVDTPDGLMVFVIKQADQKSIVDLAKVLNSLTAKAQSRSIDLADLKGGTFSITNYGAIRGIHGTPIINYPEVAILGTGKITDRPAVRGSSIVVRRNLPLSLSFDHRVVDGAEAARFMDVVVRRLEDPHLLLLDGP